MRERKMQRGPAATSSAAMPPPPPPCYNAEIMIAVRGKNMLPIPASAAAAVLQLDLNDSSSSRGSSVSSSNSTRLSNGSSIVSTETTTTATVNQRKRKREFATVITQQHQHHNYRHHPQSFFFLVLNSAIEKRFKYSIEKLTRESTSMIFRLPLAGASPFWTPCCSEWGIAQVGAITSQSVSDISWTGGTTEKKITPNHPPTGFALIHGRTISTINAVFPGEMLRKIFLPPPDNNMDERSHHHQQHHHACDETEEGGGRGMVNIFHKQNMEYLSAKLLLLSTRTHERNQQQQKQQQQQLQQSPLLLTQEKYALGFCHNRLWLNAMSVLRTKKIITAETSADGAPPETPAGRVVIWEELVLWNCTPKLWQTSSPILQNKLVIAFPVAVTPGGTGGDGPAAATNSSLPLFQLTSLLRNCLSRPLPETIYASEKGLLSYPLTQSDARRILNTRLGFVLSSGEEEEELGNFLSIHVPINSDDNSSSPQFLVPFLMLGNYAVGMTERGGGGKGGGGYDRFGTWQSSGNANAIPLGVRLCQSLLELALGTEEEVKAEKMIFSFAKISEGETQQSSSSPSSFSSVSSSPSSSTFPFWKYFFRVPTLAFLAEALSAKKQGILFCPNLK